MNFTDEEIKIIYSVFKISITAVEMKKRHKNKNDIIALEHMNKIVKKINNYMEGKN